MVEILRRSQIEAAARFHKRFDQWRLSDCTLLKLREVMPGWDEEACLLKCIAVNTLYGTQVFAIVRMAQHVGRVVANRKADGVENLVEEISNVPSLNGPTNRKSISFASKLCHFFVDSDRFPIYDEAARSILKLHLGKDYRQSHDNKYKAFCSNLQDIRKTVDGSATNRDIDRYLWLAGMFVKWCKERSKEKPQMNVELLNVFNSPTQDDISDLDALLPVRISRDFRGQAKSEQPIASHE